MKNIGEILEIDFEKLFDFVEKSNIKNLRNDINNLPRNDIDVRLFKFCNYFSGSKSDFKDSLELLRRVFSSAKQTGKTLKITAIINGWVLFKFGGSLDIIPESCVEVRLYTDFSNITLSEAKQLLGSQESEEVQEKSLVPVSENTCLSELEKKVEAAQSQISNAENKLKEEIRAMREKLELEIKKKQDLVEVKLNELRAKKEAMEKELFCLDDELYNLRCLLGDGLQISQVRFGAKAPIETPIVLFQKLRFLDEDLAKMEHLQNVNFTEPESIDRILSKRDDVFERFCPTEKCVVLIKVSKENKQFFSDTDSSLTWTFYENGNQIGILIRNGENLHIIWTDDERIRIVENLVIADKNKVKELDEDSKDETYDVISDSNFTKGLAWKQFFSRRFIFSILQGCLDYHKILELPEKVNLAIPTKYVIFSMVDNQLIDTRYKSLSDYLLFTNPQTLKGDYILPMKAISGCFTERSFWGNTYVENHERGRGEKNRVRDADIPKEVVQINYVEHPSYEKTLWHYTQEQIDEEKDEERKRDLIENNKEFEMAAKALDESGKLKITINGIKYRYTTERCRKGYVWKDTGTEVRVIRSCIYKTTWNYSKKKYYISCLKEWSASGKARANVQIYPDEFINLEFCTSDMMKNWIANQQVGTEIEGNYAYIIKFLRKSIVHLEQQESKLESLLKNHLHLLDGLNWKLAAVVYKIKKNFRVWTQKKADKFVEWVMCDLGDWADSVFIKQLPWVKETKNDNS